MCNTYLRARVKQKRSRVSALHAYTVGNPASIRCVRGGGVQWEP